MSYMDFMKIDGLSTNLLNLKLKDIHVWVIGMYHKSGKHEM